MDLWHESSSKGSFAELIELIVNKTEENATFSDSWVTDYDDLYLCEVLVHYIK